MHSNSLVLLLLWVALRLARVINPDDASGMSIGNFGISRLRQQGGPEIEDPPGGGMYMAAEAGMEMQPQTSESLPKGKGKGEGEPSASSPSIPNSEMMQLPAPSPPSDGPKSPPEGKGKGQGKASQSYTLPSDADMMVYPPLHHLPWAT